MTTLKNPLDSERHHAHAESSMPAPDKPPQAVSEFISLYNARAAFFSDSFIKRMREGNRKALAELLRYPLPPTRIDLRTALAKCIEARVADDHLFRMNDGRVYALLELKRLVPEWAEAAEQALIESDPALADKLMSPAQWNARCAFEVAFVNAMNELTELKKTKLAPASLDHYTKWFLNPLAQALEQLKVINPPGNSLIGYGKRISVREAVTLAGNLPREFEKLTSS